MIQNKGWPWLVYSWILSWFSDICKRDPS
jgi:hypothetical protein